MYSCLNAVQFFRYTGTHLSVLRRNCCIFIVLYIFSLLSILQNLCYVEMISQWQAYEQGNATGTFLVYFTDYILYFIQQSYLPLQVIDSIMTSWSNFHQSSEIYHVLYFRRFIGNFSEGIRLVIDLLNVFLNKTTYFPDKTEHFWHTNYWCQDQY